ncbi:MAG: DNA mismatch repair endonuclease MutL [archaeon]|nr:DNA mismatch repair endonuclease MutL [archaeon]
MTFQINLEVVHLSDARIIQLDEETIGHIAAGEVVERPAQVVKELLENSIDAKSSMITVNIQNGGFASIEIIDNGTGIHYEDLGVAFQRHATSKLQQHTDLEAIFSLGFRGEALASIGMVSEMELASRKEGAEGALITMSYGTVGDIQPKGMPNGTNVIVRDLFSNTPARLAFQKRPQSEIAKIIDAVVGHALANPTIGFVLNSDGRTLLNIPQNEDSQDRLYDILGAQASEMVPLVTPSEDEEIPGAERWSGYISTPEITRGKGDEIHVLINGRPIASTPFLNSIRKGYKTRLMQGRHPIAVLHLECLPSDVDVNVHPTKREVRLRNSWRILERLERAIAHTLLEIPTLPDASASLPGLDYITTLPKHRIEDNSKHSSSQHSLNQAAGIQISPTVVEKPAPPAWVQSAGQQLNLQGENSKQIESSQPIRRPISTSPLSQSTLAATDEKFVSPPLSSKERDLHRYGSTNDSISPQGEPVLATDLNELPAMEPLAQFAQSYILVQSENDLLLIDQHALHERIRYERIRYLDQDWEMQHRIVAKKLHLTARQEAHLEANLDTLKAIGFEFSHEGGVWSVLAYPMAISGERFDEMFIDILNDLSEDASTIPTIENLKDHIAFLQACRGAVKANEPLSLPEMRRLLEDMKRIPNPWACVHGRPTSLKLSIDALDHHFGRHG